MCALAVDTGAVLVAAAELVAAEEDASAVLVAVANDAMVIGVLWCPVSID